MTIIQKCGKILKYEYICKDVKRYKELKQAKDNFKKGEIK